MLVLCSWMGPLAIFLSFLVFTNIMNIVAVGRHGLGWSTEILDR